MLLLDTPDMMHIDGAGFRSMRVGFRQSSGRRSRPWVCVDAEG